MRASTWLPGALALVAACGSDDGDRWQLVGRGMSSALLSVWGTSDANVYAVGGDPADGLGPLVLHYDGAAWTRLQTGQIGTLWWVFGFEGGPIYMGGDGGVILRYEQGTFTRMATPGTNPVFGIWGSRPDDLWAVGGASGGANGGFAWRSTGGAWTEAPGFPAELSASTAIWKIYGRSATDAWLVGTNGKAIRWDGQSLTPTDTGAGESLFTVHADETGYVAVGGFGTGAIMQNDGDAWQSIGPSDAPGLIGVHLTANQDFAVGQFGAVYRRTGTSWKAESIDIENPFESFHSVWVDPAGGAWVVGGEVLSLPVSDGIMMYRGERNLTGGIDD